MKRLLKSKLFILSVLVIILALSNYIEKKISLSERGIVVGMAVDMTDDKLYNVTAQFVLAGDSSNGSSGSNRYVTISGEGPTMTAALQNLARLSGVHGSYRHNVILLVGESVLETKNTDYVMSFFFENNFLPDNIVIAMIQGKASEVLEEEAPMTTISTFHIIRFLEDYQPTVSINYNSVKDYAVNESKLLNINYMPIIDKRESEGTLDDKGTSSEKGMLYEAKRSVIIGHDNSYTVLEEDASRGLSYMLSKLSTGYIVIGEGEEREVSYALVDSTPKMNYSLEEMKVTLDLKLTVRLVELKEKDQSYVDLDMITEADKEKFIKTLNYKINSAYLQGKAVGIDAANIYTGMYARYGKEWLNKVGDDKSRYLQDITFEINSRLEIK